MKTLMEGNYKYLGVKDGWHVFKCVKSGFDQEVVLISRARLVKEDGSIQIFEPIHPNQQLQFDMRNEFEIRQHEMLRYSTPISHSTSLKPNRHIKHIPKEVTPELTTRSESIG